MKRIILIIILSGIIYGCTNVLNKPLLDQMTAESYWKTPTDLKLYINQFYPEFNGHSEFWALDANSDNLQPAAPSEVFAATRSIPASGGGWNWSNIRKVNYFLENASKVDKGSKVDLDQYLGEGYFFKAYFYYQLVQRFGDVPWYDKVLNINSKDGLMAPRDPRNQVMDSIVMDLDKAISLLQPKSKLPSGRINRACALLFKSRVCLYEGTWEKYHEGDPFGVKGSDGQKYLELAVQSAGRLIDEGDFKIYSTGHPDQDYYDLFNRTDLSNNPEVILFQTVDPDIGLGNEVWTYLNGFRGHQTGITKQLVGAYLCTDGKPTDISSNYKGDTTLTEVIENRDPRLEQTMWVPGQIQIATDPPSVFKYPTLNLGSFDEATTGYMIRKGSTVDPEQNQGASGADYGKTDAIVFRYAEVLLNYAEARAELGELTQDDLDKSVNLLRDRVEMPHLNINVGYTDPDWNFPKLSPIINEIRRERRIELALEGFRYDDLMRWAATNLIKGKRWKGARFIKGISFPAIEDQISNIPVDENHYIDRYQNSLSTGFNFNPERDYLYPIPTDELTLNKNLKQNPGW